MYRRDQQARYGKTQWTPLAPAPLTPDAGLFCAVILRAVQPAVVLPRWVCRASQLGKPDGRDENNRTFLAPFPKHLHQMEKPDSCLLSLNISPASTVFLECKLMTPVELQQLHRFMLDTSVIEVISEEMRAAAAPENGANQFLRVPPPAAASSSEALAIPELRPS